MNQPHTDDPAALTRIVLRPVATPLPLGFLALGIGSCLLTALQLSWIPSADGSQVAIVLLSFTAPLQLLAAVLGFLIRDVVMATGFGLLTGSWVSVALLLLTGRPGQTSPVLGILALAVAIALLVPAITATWSKPVASSVMTVAAARFALTGIYELTQATAWEHASGIIGIALLASSAYGSLAFALEDAQHRPILPTNRRGAGKDAIAAPLPAQLDSLTREAGVRQES